MLARGLRLARCVLEIEGKRCAQGRALCPPASPRDWPWCAGRGARQAVAHLRQDLGLSSEQQLSS
jgi:hypothetical protein